MYTMHGGALLSSLGSDIRTFTLYKKWQRKGMDCLQMLMLIYLYLQ